MTYALEETNRAGCPAEHQITAVVFDFGGVFTASPLTMFRRAAVEANIDPGELIDVFVGDYGAESNHPWHRVERGELGFDDARAWARAETRYRFGVELDPAVVLAPLLTEPVREFMLDLVRSIRDEGITTALLTNNAQELRSVWSALADWASLFDHVVDSSEIGVRKPSKQAFQLVLDRCGVVCPGAAVMVDDFEVNVEGARSVGMQAVLVEEDPASAVEAIRRMVLR